MITKNNKNGCLMAFIFITVFLIAIIFTLHRINKRGETIQDWRDKNLKNIHFKGRVLDSKEITIEGRHYGIVCIGLDYSNKESCYLYEPGISFLKIKNGKALMLLGADLLNNRVDYIEVNINNSGEEIFYKNNKIVDTYDLSLSSPLEIPRNDMKFCDEINED